MSEGTDSRVPPAAAADGAAERDTPQGDAEYLRRRTLRRGSAGWLLLTGLGVAYVVSGDFSGWNIGLSEEASAVSRSPRC